MGAGALILDVRTEQSVVEQGHGPSATRRAEVVDVELRRILDLGRDKRGRVGARVEHASRRAVLVRCFVFGAFNTPLHHP